VAAGGWWVVGGDRPNAGHEREFVSGVGMSYLAVFFAYRFSNLATRPPVSRIFCLPV
jgi:hypothetical protein